MIKNKPLLFFSTGYFMYAGTAVDTVVHDHHVIQIALSFDDIIEIILPDAVEKQKAFIIDSDQPHACKTYNTSFLLLNIDPESHIGIGLRKKYLDDRKFAPLEDKIIPGFLEQIRPLLNENRDTRDLPALTDQFLHSLSNTSLSSYDDRILNVLKTLRNVGDGPIKISDLAASVYMSQSRLIHLFTEQVGIPIRKYILWSRLLNSLQKIVETKNITRAALAGGFSDAPHFNRTFKKMFGLNPSLLLKNSQFIQVF